MMYWKFLTIRQATDINNILNFSFDHAIFTITKKPPAHMLAVNSKIFLRYGLVGYFLCHIIFILLRLFTNFS